MHITNLEIENFKRIRAVAFKPADGVQEIRGANAQGKSSVLDAIEAALAGKSASPERPIRDNQRSATVRCDLGTYVVTRRWTPTGTTLTVTSADGAKIREQQTVLDSLFSQVSFDPFRFIRSEPKKQAQLLRELVGVDTSDLDAEREEVYAERAEMNVAIRAEEARLATMPAYEDAPDQPVSVSELTGELMAANEVRRQHEEKIRAVKKFRSDRVKMCKDIDDKSKQIEQLKQQIENLAVEIGSLNDELVQLDESIASEQAEIEQAQLPDIEAIRTRINECESINNKVKANAERRAARQALDSNRADADKMTKRLTAIDAEKADRLARVVMPVDGLGFDSDGVTLHGVPLSQASSAEQIRVGLGICSALNPSLRTILVREGSLLDSVAMAELANWATVHDFQVFVERVSERGGDGSILIEDGEIAD